MVNPSPACEVKVGSADYVPAVGGVNITPSQTIVIRLASQVDVDSWLIQCITTDETSDADTVSALLGIDTTNKTATFTAPAGTGKAYRFLSRVNGGVDRNGVVRSTYETTFGLYTLTSGRRVIAADETVEGNSTFGWIAAINPAIRSSGSSSGSAPEGTSGQLVTSDGAGGYGTSVNAPTGTSGQLATTDGSGGFGLSVNAPTGTAGHIARTDGDGGFTSGVTCPTGLVVGTTDAQTLTNKNLSSPQVSGNPWATTANGYVESFLTQVTTSSTSETSCGTYSIGDESQVALDAIVTWICSPNVTKSGRAKLSAVYRRTGSGAPTMVGTFMSNIDKTTEGDTVTVDVDSNTLRVRVAAADSDTRYWVSDICVHDTYIA
jgi:hypothetical protein